MTLLEVEEKERLKATVLSEAEERRLMEKTQRKVEYIYSQLQHYDPLWVLSTVLLERSDAYCIHVQFLVSHWNCTNLRFDEFDTETMPSTFWCRDSGGEFLPFLLVSKGKKLFARLLPFLKHDAAVKILHIVTSNLPTLMSRDAEEVGRCFYMWFSFYSKPTSRKFPFRPLLIHCLVMSENCKLHHSLCVSSPNVDSLLIL